MVETLSTIKDVGLTWHDAYTFLAVAIDGRFLLSTLTVVGSQVVGSQAHGWQLELAFLC